MENLNNLFTGIIPSLLFTVQPNGSFRPIYGVARISKPLDGMPQFIVM